MTGSCLFNYESYYNGLMIDWGLIHLWLMTMLFLWREFFYLKRSFAIVSNVL